MLEVDPDEIEVPADELRHEGTRERQHRADTRVIARASGFVTLRVRRPSTSTTASVARRVISATDRSLTHDVRVR